MFNTHSTFPRRIANRPRAPRWLGAMLGGCLFWSAVPAHAQDDDEVIDSEELGDEVGAEAEAAESETKEEDKPSAPEKQERGRGIHERPDQTYLFVGARYRLQTVPKAVQNWFAQGGETIWVNTPGVEFAIRKDRFEYNIFGMLGMYSMKDVPFKGNSDVELAWETISADINILFLGSDFMWSTPDFAPGLSFIYGAGIGLGVVFGDLTRTQAYPANGTYVPCTNVGVPFVPGPGGVGQYCDAENNHYGGYVESKTPPVFPWIAGQLGLRYKVHEKFVGRLELGFTVTSLFFGLGLDYGL